MINEEKDLNPRKSRVLETRYDPDMNAKYRRRISSDGELFWTEERCCDKPLYTQVSAVFKPVPREKSSA